MKRKNIKGIIITMVLMLVMVITLTINNLNVYALTEVEDVYQISTKSDLEDFRDLVNSSEPSANAILLNDIDLEGSDENQWTPINNYAGTFDGNGYTISNLFIDSTEDNVGLFSNGASGAVIKNLAVHGDVKTTKAKAAGIMSSASNISVINCVNMVNVSANTNAGGIVGHSTSSNLTIEKCSNYGDVHAKNENAGGIAGTLRSSVIKCFNAGNITADSRYAGGIAGFFPGGSGEPEVSNCYNIGNITSQKFVGGIVGYNYYHKISKCFNIGTLTNNGTGSDKALIGGIVSNSFSDEIEE